MVVLHTRSGVVVRASSLPPLPTPPISRSVTNAHLSSSSLYTPYWPSSVAQDPVLNPTYPYRYTGSFTLYDNYYSPYRHYVPDHYPKRYYHSDPYQWTSVYSFYPRNKSYWFDNDFYGYPYYHRSRSNDPYFSKYYAQPVYTPLRSYVY
ncbi:unnamed protein product [Bursaphelenchus okinawaensis]|uniref:Uncharacterized protein n=1 Tax=Bursaphelenchus okinawaensis TaxID=465554 RepID=A0A811KJS3_9BILA|nr:unnamed protein product [Bursaphelenchus okinawaensis]CAG9104378.1 unnamed protein product [Bursaphelenchus okinawaensis]